MLAAALRSAEDALDTLVGQVDERVVDVASRDATLATLRAYLRAALAYSAAAFQPAGCTERMPGTVPTAGGGEGATAPAAPIAPTPASGSISDGDMDDLAADPAATSPERGRSARDRPRARSKSRSLGPAAARAGTKGAAANPP